jgi:hypothetical protein
MKYVSIFWFINCLLLYDIVTVVFFIDYQHIYIVRRMEFPLISIIIPQTMITKIKIKWLRHKYRQVNKHLKLNKTITFLAEMFCSTPERNSNQCLWYTVQHKSLKVLLSSALVRASYVDHWAKTATWKHSFKY